MSDSELTFGRRAAQCPSASALLEMEVSEGRAERFSTIDTALAGLVVRCARGDRVVRIVRGDRQHHVELHGVPAELRTEVAQAFRLDLQQSRGDWFLPETVPVKAGPVNFAAHFREYPRYAHTLAAEERGKVSLTGSPDAMVLWSVLEPLFDALVLPILLRSEKVGKLTRDEFAVAWSDVEGFAADLGLNIHEALPMFGWGRGWSRFSADQQIVATTNLLSEVANDIGRDTLCRYRARATKSLVAHYYSKAKNGRAKRRQVIVKEHWRTLAAFFSGDWLAFVEYLGEQPHDEERIVTALPETKVIVGGREEASAIAARRNLPVEEVERMLGAYWESAGGESPVRQRAAVLLQYWQEFDSVHARQAPGMPPLWSLVQEGGWGDLEPQPWTPYQRELFRRVLSTQLVSEIDRLWGTTVLAKWPDRIISEPFPHSTIAEALGPALKFWHGCALTAWFICEGPTSRTDIRGLAHYYRRGLGDLEAMGCGVHPTLFEELLGVRLGPEEPLYVRDNSIDVGHGISMNIRTSSGTRRNGFELLRDVITRHRRWWTSNVAERYVRARWESQLRAVGRQFHLMTEEKGKPPTLKQFAKHAVPAARLWFGGDVDLLYAALGQRLHTKTERRTLMPRVTVAFADLVFEALGGRPFERAVVMATPEQGCAQAAAQDRHHKLRRLSGESLSYVQLLEALGRPPTLKEFGSKFEWPGQVLASSTSDAWSTYERAIKSALERAKLQGR